MIRFVQEEECYIVRVLDKNTGEEIRSEDFDNFYTAWAMNYAREEIEDGNDVVIDHCIRLVPENDGIEE